MFISLGDLLFNSLYEWIVWHLFKRLYHQKGVTASLWTDKGKNMSLEIYFWSKPI